MKGGLICWVKMDPKMIIEVHKRAAKAASNSFRTATFVPPLARSRKTALDKLLMSYKKEDSNFRYIVRNGSNDLRVFIKRLTEYQFVPYREIEIASLGAISPLKPVTKNENENENQDNIDENEAEDGFEQSPRKIRPNYIPKEDIFHNIKSLLDGFNPKEKKQASA